MKIVSAAEMREIDRITTEKHGISALQLMENAGTAVAEHIAEQYAFAARIAVVCGKGNNGGDGFVCARKLMDAGNEVDVYLLAELSEVQGEAAQMLAALPRKPTFSAELSGEQLSEYDLIVDALLGSGFRAPLAPKYAAIIKAMNSSGVPVVAIDVPSGMDADAMQPGQNDAVNATSAVTFTAYKPAHIFGMDPESVSVREIGTPREAVASKLGLNLITPADYCELLAPRKIDAHKGDFGHVLIFGGSRGKAGAAAMAGMAALRSGAGLVSVAAPESVLSTIASFAPELMTEPLSETGEGTISVVAMEAMRKRGLELGDFRLAIGPGLSRNPETAQFVRSLVDRARDQPIVLDADGLNAFAGDMHALAGRGRPLIVTPHPGEMARLTGKSTAAIQNDRIGMARTFAKEHNAYLVLKGSRTIIAAPSGEIWINTTGNPGMATGGTGDILTGIIAGLLAQHPAKPLEVLLAAVHLHGLAGDLARDQVGEIALIATDLLLALPMAMRQACATVEK